MLSGRSRAVKAVSEYDAVVLGSVIYQGRRRPEAVRFLRRHERRLNQNHTIAHGNQLSPSMRYYSVRMYQVLVDPRNTARSVRLSPM